MKLFVPIILGSGRAGRRSEFAAKFILEEAKKYGFRTELIDVREFSLSRTDNTVRTEKAKKFSKIMREADGLIVVSPEYNHGYPGELKMMLDQLYEEYNRKPIGICGVSAGITGGARMVEQLRLVAIEFQMVPIRTAVYFRNALELFEKEGQIKNLAQYQTYSKEFFEELSWYAKALKRAREDVN